METVKRNVKLLFNYERLKYKLRGKEGLFEKMWGLSIEQRRRTGKQF